MVGAAPGGIGSPAQPLPCPVVADEPGQGAAGILGVGQPAPCLGRRHAEPHLVLVGLHVGVEAVDRCGWSMELHPQSGSNSQRRSVMVCSTPSGVVIVCCRGSPMNREFLQGFLVMAWLSTVKRPLNIRVEQKCESRSDCPRRPPLR